ncbi:hypothetical protein ABZP36_020740 [Zizania latifolia]
MKTVQLMILGLVLVVLSSGMMATAYVPDGCRVEIISPKCKDRDTCLAQCRERIHLEKKFEAHNVYGECVAEGCKCIFCELVGA